MTTTDTPPLVGKVNWPTVGQEIPGHLGAIILDEKIIRTYDHRRDSIVLCVVPSDSGRGWGYSPFVTWHRCVHTDAMRADGEWKNDEYVYIGHYHRTLEEAVEEFQTRVIEKQTLVRTT